MITFGINQDNTRLKGFDTVITIISPANNREKKRRLTISC